MRWNEFRHCIRHFSAQDQSHIQKAFEIGEKAHIDQKRKSGEPYFSHPVAIAEMLIDIGADADTVIAALLHDTVEDTPVTLDYIEKEFGPTVRQLIDGVTKLTTEEFANSPTKDDQIETLRKMFSLLEKDVRIMVIKLMDRLHNMQTVQFLSEERQKKMARETLDVYAKIADRLCMQDVRDELEELCLAILQPDLLKELTSLRKKNEKKGEEIIKKMNKALREKTDKKSVSYNMMFEKKAWQMLVKQLKSDGATTTGVSAHTIVFTTKTSSDCYSVLGLLHGVWNREILSFQDFINAPRINGYEGIHTTVLLEDGTRIRCKIRSEEMQEYAHRGIATVCFDSNAEGVLQYLPWTKHISSLTENTKERSQEFWESLQSDILEDSIVIHGPGDEPALVPQGANALDGAFYLFDKNALKIKNIFVNGVKVTFSTPLEYASSLDIEVASRPTVTREWLYWTHTGLATAKIRAALGSMSEKTKRETGKYWLQETFTTRQKGFLEEFNEEELEKSLHSLGMQTLDETYIAIADGRLDAAEVYSALFEKEKPGKEPENGGKRSSTSLHFLLDLRKHDAVMEALRIYDRYDFGLLNLRFRPSTKKVWKITLKAPMTLDEQRSIISQLHAVGISDVQSEPTPSKIRFVFGILLLLTVWGFDPAVAYHLISTYQISTIDMTIVRFWTLTVASLLLVIGSRTHQDVQKAPLPIKNRSLWASVFLLLGVSLATYTALQTTQPSHYSIPMTAAGLLLTSIVNRKRWMIMGTTWSVLIAGMFLLVNTHPGWSATGILFTILSVATFSAFSFVSERYKRKEHIKSRAAQYFFLLSLLCALLTLPLLPLSTLNTLGWNVITQMALFSIIFVGGPYYLYYYLLSHREIDFVLRYSFLIIYTTMIGQMLFTNQMVSIWTFFSGLIVTAGALIPIAMKKTKRHSH